MRKAFSLLLACILLANCFGLLCLAADDTSQAYLFELTVDDSGIAAVADGDEFTVKLTLTQTKPGTTDEYAIYAAQDEIYYNRTIFELVPYSDTSLANVMADRFDNSLRPQSNNINNLRFNFASSAPDGDMYPNNMTIAEFTFRVIGRPDDGDTAFITNQKYIMVAKNPYDLYTATANDLQINFQHDEEPTPEPVKYKINITQPTGATIASTPPNEAAAGETTVLLTTYRDEMYRNHTITWSIMTADDSAVPFTVTSPTSAQFEMPAADVYVNVTLTPDTNTGSGGGLVSGGGGGGTPPSELEILDDETPTTGIIFTDVLTTHWAYEYVYYLSELGFVNGKDAGIFAPSDPITRAEFVTILSRMCGDALPSSNITPFDDVVADSYYEQAVSWAYLTGVTKGTTDTKFSPHALITRQEMATMIVRYTAYKHFNFVKYNDEKDFTDSSSIMEYARESVSIMQQADIIAGYEDGSFKPYGNTTRAETAKMLALVHKLIAT